VTEKNIYMKIKATKIRMRIEEINIFHSKCLVNRKVKGNCTELFLIIWMDEIVKSSI
jgi:hypothetical protein